MVSAFSLRGVPRGSCSLSSRDVNRPPARRTNSFPSAHLEVFLGMGLETLEKLFRMTNSLRRLVRCGEMCGSLSALPLSRCYRTCVRRDVGVAVPLHKGVWRREVCYSKGLCFCYSQFEYFVMLGHVFNSHPKVLSIFAV